MSERKEYEFIAMTKGKALEILDEYKEINGEENIQSKDDIYLLIECAYARGWLDGKREVKHEHRHS